MGRLTVAERRLLIRSNIIDGKRKKFEAGPWYATALLELAMED
jgi:hypothetical protein